MFFDTTAQQARSHPFLEGDKGTLREREWGSRSRYYAYRELILSIEMIFVRFWGWREQRANSEGATQLPPAPFVPRSCGCVSVRRCISQLL